MVYLSLSSSLWPSSLLSLYVVFCRGYSFIKIQRLQTLFNYVQLYIFLPGGRGNPFARLIYIHCLGKIKVLKWFSLYPDEMWTVIMFYFFTANCRLRVSNIPIPTRSKRYHVVSRNESSCSKTAPILYWLLSFLPRLKNWHCVYQGLTVTSEGCIKTWNLFGVTVHLKWCVSRGDQPGGMQVKCEEHMRAEQRSNKMAYTFRFENCKFMLFFYGNIVVIWLINVAVW